MKTTKLLSSEDAVSEVMDFVIILGILLLSISIIGLVGYPILEKAQEAKHIENTKQSFTVMGKNINRVVLGQAPSQSLEVKIYDEIFSVIPNSSRESKINITLTNGSNIDESFEWALGAIEAEFDTVTIAYENTGTWIKYDSGATMMLSRPSFVLRGDSLMIPVTTIVGSSSISGRGFIHVVASEITDDLIYRPDIKSIRIIVNSNYNEGWQKQFLNETNGWTRSFPGKEIMEKNFTSPVSVYILRKTINVETIS